MEYVKIYLLSLLIFTVSVWTFDAIFIIRLPVVWLINWAEEKLPE